MLSVDAVKRFGPWALGGALLVGALLAVALWPRRLPPPRLLSVGPRTVSNQTSQPLLLVGSRLRHGQRILVRGPGRAKPIALALDVVDPHHAYARLPPVSLPPSRAQARFRISLEGWPGHEVPLTVVNDRAFPDLTRLVVTPKGRLFALSKTTDQLFAIDPETREVKALPTGDGPSAETILVLEGKPWLAVGHAFEKALWLFPADLSSPPRKLPGPLRVSALAAAPDGDILYVAEQVEDTVEAVSSADGHLIWRAPVDANPRALALEGDLLAVGSAQTGRVQLLDSKSGRLVRSLQPRTSVSILGGRTDGFGRWVMGGTAVRDLRFAPSLKALFVASEGPNVGPNPSKMEVTLNPGVGVVDPASGRFVRHLGFGEGLIQGLAFDSSRKLLYAADSGLGRIRVVDATRLVQSDVSAKSALLQSLVLPPPKGFPLIWPNRTASAGARGRPPPSPSIESGPTALALSPDGDTLYALDRFTGTLAEVDVRGAATGHARLLRQLPVVDTLAERTRRMGEILFEADPAGTGITCEACHVEGHTGGIFFAKTHPLRIYRSPTLRGVKDTPPYFNPESTKSLSGTVRLVGNRNRFHRLPFTPKEIDALTTYAGGITVPPNPFRGDSGAPPKRMALPWGKSGVPAKGLALFKGMAGCVRCHPAPLYTLDQDGATRGRYLDVGTPPGLPLRPSMQDLRVHRFEVPSLLGAWDAFPLLTSATVGLSVKGDAVVPSIRWPLRYIARHPHGGSPRLSTTEQADLVAFLRSR